MNKIIILIVLATMVGCYSPNPDRPSESYLPGANSELPRLSQQDQAQTLAGLSFIPDDGYKQLQLFVEVEHESNQGRGRGSANLIRVDLVNRGARPVTLVY